MDFINLAIDHLKFCSNTFPDSSSESSLTGLMREVEEVRQSIKDGAPLNEIAEEYADILLYLIDSAFRAGIPPTTLIIAMHRKIIKNKNRSWSKNPDNTYSHLEKPKILADLDCMIEKYPGREMSNNIIFTCNYSCYIEILKAYILFDGIGLSRLYSYRGYELHVDETYPDGYIRFAPVSNSQKY